LLTSRPMPASLSEELERLPTDVSAELAAHHFDRQRLIALAARVQAAGADDNRVTGNVEPPAAGDVRELPAADSAEAARLREIGLSALARGECALVVLAGGMATRMGGVVKALLEAVPGHTFLELRLNENAHLGKLAGSPPPLWLMTSDATHAPIVEALRAHAVGAHVSAFQQHLSLRVTPAGGLFLDAEGRPSVHAPGHGDLPDALRESGLIGRFLERGGKSVMIANLDNLGATLDPMVLGLHLEHGKRVSCEVVDKLGSDRGGIPVRWNGRPVVLEEFRLPAGFDPKRVRVFNTNTFLVDARALFELDIPWTFFLVKKKVGETPVVQFERLIGEITSHLETRFIRMPREGAGSRFLPVKDLDELAARRSEIELVARERGMLP
jgi:UTP--glucose-1-phosphate uridylyltransferase